MHFKAIGLDFFGTLIEAKAEVKDCIESMCTHLNDCGYKFSVNDFIDAYHEIVKDYRRVRYNDFREVNNRIWITDTLNKMGFNADPSNSEITSAVNKYFNTWQLKLFPEVSEVLERLSKDYKIALISNFTHTEFITSTLRELRIHRFFDKIIVSDTFGWRKPHPSIFKHFLNTLEVRAEDAVFVGDDIESDIKGAKNMGIKAILLARIKPSLKNIDKTQIEPDYIIKSLVEFEELIE
jgi:2-haloalkanoic acid dehalogenase type II